MRSKLVFGAVCASCVGVTWLIIVVYRLMLHAYEHSESLNHPDYAWFFRLLLNLVGYATIMVPGCILYKFLEKTNYFDKITSQPPGCVSRALFACFGPYERLPEGAAGKRDERGGRGAELALCCTGLMGAYLVWGLLQEKVMTQTYVVADGSALRFSDSQLLVLANRVGALAAAAARLACTRRPVLAAPLYKFSYCALSNVLSAWCQYEALKYVSFPTQVLSKSCKVIPVMLMGKLISRNQYQPYEYLTAVVISLGMALFMVGSTDRLPGEYTGPVGAGGGLVLLALYLCCDGFTSSWQAELFAQYSLHPLQMLCAVNASSVLLCAAAMWHRSATSGAQLLQHWGLLCDVAVLSLSSALGQLLIYRTIASFGAVVFAIIMTLRQAVSILLSCVVFGHHISVGGAVGITLVFLAVLGRVYCAHRLRTARAQTRTDT